MAYKIPVYEWFHVPNRIWEGRDNGVTNLEQAYFKWLPHVHIIVTQSNESCVLTYVERAR